MSSRPRVCAVISQTQTENVAGHASCLLNDDVAAIAKSEGVQNDLKSLQRLFGTEDETKWLAKLRDRKLAERLSLTRFRPVMPPEWRTNPRAWLSNLDIQAVLEQYAANLASSANAFRFLGAFPSDFGAILDGGQCVSPILCNLHVRKQVASGVKSIAIIFNMDVHTGPGTHWTACFIGLDPARKHRYGIFYYDSVSTHHINSSATAPKNVPSSLKWIREFALRIKAEVGSSEFKVHQNTRQKQRKQTECGVYATIFIILCVVTDIPFSQICNNVMKNDDFMQEMRSILFR